MFLLVKKLINHHKRQNIYIARKREWPLLSYSFLGVKCSKILDPHTRSEYMIGSKYNEEQYAMEMINPKNESFCLLLLSCQSNLRTLILSSFILPILPFLPPKLKFKRKSQMQIISIMKVSKNRGRHINTTYVGN